MASLPSPAPVLTMAALTMAELPPESPLERYDVFDFAAADFSPDVMPVSVTFGSRAGGISPLPAPPARPVPPGSDEADKVRRYMDDALGRISERYITKFGMSDPGSSVESYDSFGELAVELDELVNYLWLSGLPSLQAPYLLTITGELLDWIDGFAPDPDPSLALLRKMDYVCASLVAGFDLNTRKLLPGFEPKKMTNDADANPGRAPGFTRTDMIRLRSIVSQTRAVIANVLDVDLADYRAVLVVDGDDDDFRIRRPKRTVTTVLNEEMVSPVVADRKDAKAIQDAGMSPLDNETLRRLREESKVYEKTLLKLGDKLDMDAFSPIMVTRA